MSVVHRADVRSSHVGVEVRLGVSQVNKFESVTDHSTAVDKRQQSCLSCGQPLGSWALDPLTGWLDRRGWSSEAPRTFAQARYKTHPVALLMVDIDCFKWVNDEYGHLAGDAVLKAVATIILRRSRTRDVVCRYGGDEFFVLLPSTTHVDALSIGRSIREDCRALQTTVKLRGGQETVIGNITVSLGLAVHGVKCASDLEVQFLDAGFALRHAKRWGRDRVSVQTGIACGCKIRESD